MGADAANLTGTRTVLPPPDTAVIADLAALLSRDDGPLTLVDSDGQGVLLPQQLRAVLIQATASFAAGRAVTVALLDDALRDPTAGIGKTRTPAPCPGRLLVTTHQRRAPPRLLVDGDDLVILQARYHYQ